MDDKAEKKNALDLLAKKYGEQKEFEEPPSHAYSLVSICEIQIDRLTAKASPPDWRIVSSAPYSIVTCGFFGGYFTRLILWRAISPCRIGASQSFLIVTAALSFGSIYRL